MSDLYVRFRNVGIDDRQVSEVIGIAHGIIADGEVNQAEANYLNKWLDAREQVTDNPVIRLLNNRLRRFLADSVLDADEAADLLMTLTAFAGGDFEAGEITKATSLPLCDPAPTMVFQGVSICFTGTFAFGTRKACEAAAEALGAVPGSLTAKTRYLVIGTYATDSWSQSAFGRKIEKAVEMRGEGKPIRIVGETHWIEQMKAVDMVRLASDSALK
jgi:NAD-dependent DNA ligase